ncbi:MAG: hypothetical protein CMB80_20650 [Flammeovirgaceae bacterium]|nr:hypothetical protein [Flammeovirgaceae bacterium]MBE61221.1 hypothetical protein [Flammeovirgaceae bacterium]MBR07116.1 hypothetical protein [Rickettsiales bacterium]HCX24821.1 hypothetical protein [Cytophagales bacterium]|tara:strand:- start:9580 stop:10779 length:1200 start_codon:yes stop_codon:yes gene_type:complete
MNLSRSTYIIILNLILVGIIGCFLRFYFLHPVAGINYGYVLHAHSHLAFLGWVFMALYVLIIYAYLPREIQKTGTFSILFILLQLANLGMLFTFPFMGYALWSILFSAMHAITAMVFAGLFIRKARLALPEKHQLSFLFIKWGLILMVISNLAPFALGPVSAIKGKGDLYYLLIYFYLHFQYNGWFIFAIIGLILRLLERFDVNTNNRLIRAGFKLKLIAVFPAYTLSALWTDPDAIWQLIAVMSAVIQLAGIVCIGYFIIRHQGVLLQRKVNMLQILFWVGLVSLAVQHLLMLLSAIPALANLAFTRNIVIAYLHLVLLGFVSVWLFFILLKTGSLQLSKSSSLGLGGFLTAFVITELILVFQGYIPNSIQWLFYLAIVQLAGFLSLFFNMKLIKPTS